MVCLQVQLALTTSCSLRLWLVELVHLLVPKTEWVAESLVMNHPLLAVREQRVAVWMWEVAEAFQIVLPKQLEIPSRWLCCDSVGQYQNHRQLLGTWQDPSKGLDSVYHLV